MRSAVLTLASALAIVLAGTSGLGASADEDPLPVGSFSRVDRAGPSEDILFKASREPGRGVAVAVEVPGLMGKDVASARVVFKRGDVAVAGVPLDAGNTRDGRAAFRAVAPDTGAWTSAIVLVEKQDRALLIEEFREDGLKGARGPVSLPALPGVDVPMNAVERAGVALELVVKEALLLPGPVERFLFG